MAHRIDLGSNRGSRAERTRLTSDEVRSRVLDAAMEHVTESGLSVGFENLSMDELIKAADVPRSSTYRLWESREVFIADLLVTVAEHSARSLLVGDTLDIAVGLVSANLDRLATEEGRKALMTECIRVGLEHNYYAVIDSVDWQSFLAMSATLLSNTRLSTSRRIEEVLRDGNEEFIEAMASFHREFAQVLGFRLRPEYDNNYRLYAVLCAALVEGAGVRHLSNPAITDNFYPGPPTLTEAPAEWSLPSLGVLAVFERFMIPDPDYDADRTIERFRSGELFGSLG